MRQTHRTLGYLASLVLLSISASRGQSLGDVARQQRQNEQAKPAPKVITNDDISGPGLEQSGSEKLGRNRGTAPHRTSKTAEQWKAEILAQKRSIANLQTRMERLTSTIHFARVPTAYNAAQYNERQELKLDQVQQMQAQLDQQRAQLEAMQEAARQDGFGNGVYDP
jgi:hypothetical protein